jgi:hypothetical protein
MRTLKCVCCGWLTLTRTEARRSYGRLIGNGLTSDEAKALSPRCYRCTTSVLKPNIRAARAARAAIT